MELPVHEGDVVAGKYAVERVLGDGGMGFVVAARHLDLGARVALKFLLPEAAKNAEACLRFVREARAAAKIKGEHVARVLDVGTRDDGTPFIVMEYLEGRDLGRVLETDGPLAISDAVHYVLQACEAVAQAHALGIVHRDLKPANLFLCTSPGGSPLVKVLDFGISKSSSVFARTLSPDITTVNASMGTPQYMSPEQARDAAKVDARGDVWALGAILYELVAGRPAFDGDDVPAIVMMIATEEPHALESVRPDVPPALAAVVRRCLRKNRDERFADVAELARALEAFGPPEARPIVARIARILGHDSLPPVAISDESESVRPNGSRKLGVAFALVAAASAAGGYVWWERSDTPVFARAAIAPPLGPVATERPPAPAARSPASALPSPVTDAPALVAADRSNAVSTEPAPAAKPAGGRPFDATKAATELFAAAERASTCTKTDAPSGHGRATVSFSADGRVKRVSLSAPFAGGSNEACLREAFLGAKIPPFRGESRDVGQRFRVIAPSEPGTLTFQSNVPAEVALDGRSLGPTPKSVTVAAGNHTIVFSHPELGRKEHDVELAPGQDKTVSATFR